MKKLFTLVLFLTTAVFLLVTTAFSAVSFTSSTTTQISNGVNISKSVVNAQIIRVQIVIGGTNGGSISATQFAFSTTGSTNASTDIVNAKLFYTGTSTTFATTTQFGSTVASPSGNFSITGSTQTFTTPGTYYFWLVYDVSSSATAGNVLDAQCTQITVGGTNRTPTQTNPNGTRSIVNPVSSTVTQGSVTPTLKGALNKDIIRVEVTKNSDVTASLNLTQLDFNTVGSTSDADIANAKVFYTGTNGVFSATTQFGSTVVSPSGSFSVTGSQTLPTGTGYFWLAYDISSSATIGNVVDAQGTQITVGGSNYSTTTPNPSGSRTIVNPVSSTTVTQASTANILAGTNNNAIIKFQVTVNTDAAGILLTQLDFSTEGSTNAADIANAKVFYTGTTNTFSTGTQFGSTVVSPSGSFSVTGSQALPSGTSYFWLSYDIASGATAGNIVDAQGTQITVGGSTYTPTTADPDGSRQLITPSTNVIIGSGTESNGNTEYPAPFGNYWMGARQQFIYRASELTAAGFTAGEINKFGFNVVAVNGAGVHNDFSIKMKNSTVNNLTGFQSGFTTVVNPVNHQPILGWNLFTLNTPFPWDGTSHIIVEVCFYTNPYTENASTEWTTGLGTGTSRYIFNDGQSGICGLTTGNLGTSPNRPNARFIRNSDQAYTSSTTTQPITSAVSVGGSNAAVIAVQIVTNGAANPISVSQLDFSTAGSTDPVSDITSAKVYYTGTSSTYSSSTLFGSTSSPNGTFSVTGTQILAEGTNYFWLAYDISSSATIGNVIDAQSGQITVGGNNYTPAVTNPAGSRTISAPLTVTTTQPITSGAAKNSTNAVIAVQVTTNGDVPLNLTQLNFNTSGTTDIANDVTSAKVFYTGTSSSFAVSSQYGSTVSSPNGSFTVSGTQTLTAGTNYFWLAYDIPESATIDNVIDAQCEEITVSGVQYAPTVTNPTGSRTIISAPSSVIIGSGTGANTSIYPVDGTTYPAPFGNLFTGARHQFIYTASELIAAGWVAGAIEKFGFNVIATNDAGVHKNFTMKMKNSSSSSLSSFETGTTTVLNSINYQPIGGWNMFVLDTPFMWDGTSNIVVEVSFNNHTVEQPNNYTSNASTEWTTGLSDGISFFAFADGTADIFSLSGSSSTNRPNAKFARNANQTFVSATVTQPNTDDVFRNRTNQQIISAQVATDGNLNPLNITQLQFNTNGSTNPSGDITSAKVFYTGNGSVFADTAQFGSTINFPSGSFSVNGSRTLAEGTNYFWLVYDIPVTATVNNVLDAECIQITVAGNNHIPAVTSPSGSRTIIPAVDVYVNYTPTPPPDINSANPLPVTSKASYITATGVTMVGGTDFATNVYYTYNWPSTMNTSKYLTFTVTPDETHLLKFKTLKIEIFNTGSASVQNIVVRTSLDNYTNNVGTIAINQSSIYKYSLDISSITESSSTVTFRLYPYGGSGNRELMVYTTTGITLYGEETPNSAPLPVELVSFIAESKRLNAELKWGTATEVNNYGFEVERSAERSRSTTAAGVSTPLNAQWTKVGFIEGSGTTNSPKEYSFTDKNLTAGKYSYRLKQIDRDGKFSYSQSIEVEVGSVPKVFALEQNYPNPFNPSTTIGFTLHVSGFTLLKIYDAIGREVATLVNEELEAGVYHQKTFEAGNFASGVYFVRLVSGNKFQLKKMMLLK